MLWHVDGASLYLLGTVHVSDEPIALGDTIEAVVAEAQTVAFETNFDVPPPISVGQQKKGHRLSDTISSELLAATKAELAALGVEVDAETRQPWDIALEVVRRRTHAWGFSHPGVDPTVRARCSRKALNFLEPVDAGLRAFAAAPADEQERFLEHAILRQIEGRALVTRLVTGWRTRNLPDLTAVSNEQHAILPTTMSKVIGGRNAAWIPHLLRLARSKRRVVVAVGVLHLVGQGNLLAMLEANGLNCSLLAS